MISRALGTGAAGFAGGVAPPAGGEVHAPLAWSNEQCRDWVIVGGRLGIAIGVLAALAIPAALLLARRFARRQATCSSGLALAALALPLGALLLRQVAPRLFLGLTCKEGLMELVTLPVLLAAAAVAVDGAANGQSRGWAWAWAGSCLLVFLEEIDWGQLIFGFVTPAWARGATGRASTLNFHNTPASSVAFAVVVLGLFVLLPLMDRHPRLRPKLRARGVVAPSPVIAGSALITVFGVNLAGVALGLERHLQEATELSLALLLLGISLEQRWASAGAR
ncbi:MAG: hypothetical protein IT372_28990 [Polyangiaceae bacterium]|nr:hypothetical protein [Polyangiaceae bacterium]